MYIRKRTTYVQLYIYMLQESLFKVLEAHCPCVMRILLRHFGRSDCMYTYIYMYVHTYMLKYMHTYIHVQMFHEDTSTSHRPTAERFSTASVTSFLRAILRLFWLLTSGRAVGVAPRYMSPLTVFVLNVPVSCVCERECVCVCMCVCERSLCLGT